MQIPHVRRVEWPPGRAGSFASRIRTGEHSGCAVALLGMPDDTGVHMNHGYTGAAEGPAAFRTALAGYGTAVPHGWDWPAVHDAGDVQPAADLAQTHERVEAAAAAILEAGMLPVGIGGGHDLTLPFVRASLARYGSMRGIYIDAHLDVRDEVGSGMPFRRLLEDDRVKSIDVVGLDPCVNAAEHMSWFLANGGRAGSLAVEGAWPEGALFFSFDLDAIDASHAPGVSARNPAGMTSAAASAWAYAAGASEEVRCFDLMELCPPRDAGGRTARLAAHLFLRFLAGVSRRQETAG